MTVEQKIERLQEQIRSMSKSYTELLKAKNKEIEKLRAMIAEHEGKSA